MLIFIPVVFSIYFLLNKLKLFKIATASLLCASLFFYGAYKIEYVYILIVSILFNYFISYALRFNFTRKIKKLILICGLTCNILILIGFKYFVFLADTYNQLFHTTFNTMNFIMPLGISFFTIQQISYIIDCYKEKVSNYSLLEYALYVSFFPQLISGPIVRHQEMIPQFRDISKRTKNQNNIFLGIFLITVGLVKKVILADGLIDFIDYVTNYKLFSNFLVSWIYSISIMLQCYFDFSGYCDLALGSALLFNIKLPWNFSSPFQVKSISEYWSKWNITLIRFLKDYIYKPLGADKKGVFRTCVNIMIVFFAYGCYFGSNPVKLFYGILNGLLICINKIWEKLNINIPKVISHIITFITIILCAPLIKVSTFHDYFYLIKTMLGNNFFIGSLKLQGIDLIFNYIPPPHNAKINLFIFLTSLIIVLFSKNSTQLAKAYVKSNNLFYTIILLLLFVYSVLAITKSKSFVYFIF